MRRNKGNPYPFSNVFLIVFVAGLYFFTNKIKGYKFTKFMYDTGYSVKSVKNPILKIQPEFPNITFRQPLLPQYKLPKTYNIISVGDLGDDALLPDPDFQKTSDQHNLSIIGLKNVFVSPKGVILHPDGNFYYQSHDCLPTMIEKQNLPKLAKLVVGKTYDSVIAYNHAYSYAYAHFTTDVMTAIAAFPQELLNKSVVLAHKKTNLVYELSTFGLRKDQIVGMFDGWIFARHYYTISPMSCDRIVASLLNNLREKIVQKYGLDKEAPTKYVIYNRNKPARYIANFNKIYKAITNKYSNIQWEKSPNFKGYKQAATYFNQIKLFYAVHGAMLTNALFMQHGTVVIELMIQRWTTNFVFLIPQTGKHYIIGRDPNIPHRMPRYNVVSIPLILQMIEAGLNITERSTNPIQTDDI